MSKFKSYFNNIRNNHVGYANILTDCAFFFAGASEITPAKLNAFVYFSKTNKKKFYWFKTK